MHQWLILPLSMTFPRGWMAGLPPDLDFFGKFVFHFPTHELVTKKCKKMDMPKDLHTISSRLSI